ncbi:JNK-interacting protein 1 isoform X1 [Diprion similis]|uniref:JNK-interacting protein 1 isoform X1 n=1 Tax=Diprion similis TaxID=362088 RepID=UPI001EF97DDF|nr:JNK-interacting protein 1 isoform X1 [Diprion similis]
MADSEFEEFRHYFERLPQHLKAPISNYTLVHDVMVDDSPTSSQGSDGDVGQNGAAGDSEDEEVVALIHRHGNHSEQSSGDDDEELDHHCSIVADSDFSLFGGLSSRRRSVSGAGGGQGRSEGGGCGRESVISDVGDSCSSLSSWPTPEHVPSNRNGSGCTGSGERRRRRLPEIPKTKKSISMCHSSLHSSPSLADELGTATSTAGRPHLVLRKCHPRLRHEDSSPDSERMTTDSGHSTAHSPDNGPKSVSPIPCSTMQNTNSVSPSSTPGSGGVPFTQLELLEATHRGLHKFVPRHHDEIDLEIGDPIYVQKEADDLWCEGVNLRTGRQGIFPSAYAVDMDYSDFDPSAPKVKRERYLLGYLGSVETLAHKGTGVVCQAVRRIVGAPNQESPASQSCILEVSDQGLRMVDRSKPQKNRGPCHDYFYSLKNVSFCAFHPRDHRYLGFITKHPTLQRFACHVFIGQESTRPVAEAVGRAFHRFYTKFIETAFPIEDIYIE